MSLRIIFAGTPEFAIAPVKALLHSHHQLIAVYTQPDRPAGRGRALHISPVKQLALEHHIPLYQPQNLKDLSTRETLYNLHPDLLIVVAYGLILPKAVLEIPKYGCINIHASLLPRWRGAAPIQHAILAGDNVTGISIMQMDEGLDTGDILSAYPCTIDPQDTGKTLQEKLAILGSKTLMETLEKISNGKLTPQKQNKEGACYATKLSKAQAKINWQESAIMLDRAIRAYNPWPIAFTEIREEATQITHTVRIWAAAPLLAPSHNKITTLNTQPGTILGIDSDSIMVATGEGSLRLLELQLPGGRHMPVREILKSKSSWFQVGQTFL